MSASKRWIVLGVVSLWLSACVAPGRPTTLHVDAIEMLRLQALTHAQIHALRAEARVDQRGKKGRIRGTVLMFVQAPGSVRLDAMTQFGPAAILTSDGDQFALSDFREKKFVSGPTCPRNIARLLGIPLSAREAAEFLLGGTPIIEAVSADVRWDEEGFYRVRVVGQGAVRQEIDFSVNENDLNAPPAKQRLRLRRSELFAPNGASVWRVTYDEFVDVPLARGGRASMPFVVRVEQSTSATDTMIRFKDMALNPEIPAGAFAQEMTPGLQPEEAGCD